MTRSLLAGLPLFLGVFVAGCGTIGPPMAPEDIGLAARLRAEEEKEKAAAKTPAKPKEEEVEELPEEELAPLYPIGTR